MNLRLTKPQLIKMVSAELNHQTPEGRWVFTNTIPVAFYKRESILMAKLRYSKLYAELNDGDSLLAQIAGHNPQ